MMDGDKLTREVGVNSNSKEEMAGDSRKEVMDGGNSKEGMAGDSKEVMAGGNQDMVGKEIMVGVKGWVLWEAEIIGETTPLDMIGFKNKEKGISSTFLVQVNIILM